MLCLIVSNIFLIKCCHKVKTVKSLLLFLVSEPPLSSLLSSPPFSPRPPSVSPVLPFQLEQPPPLLYFSSPSPSWPCSSLPAPVSGFDWRMWRRLWGFSPGQLYLLCFPLPHHLHRLRGWAPAVAAAFVSLGVESSRWSLRPHPKMERYSAWSHCRTWRRRRPNKNLRQRNECSWTQWALETTQTSFKWYWNRKWTKI